MVQKNRFTLAASIFLGAWLIFSLTACTAATPTATSGHNLLYALDFENKAAFSSWHVGGPGTDYLWFKNTQNGKYLFEYPSGFLESEDFQFADVQIAVDVEFLAKTRVEVSLACRMQKGASGRYLFAIANDGRWNIRKWNNGAEVILAEGWSAEIKPEKNRPAGRCMGDQLTLLVNGVEIGSAHDGDLTSGGLNFGYAAEAAGAGTFDNLTVEDWGTGATPASQAQFQTQTGELLYAEPTPTLLVAIEPDTPTPLPVLTVTPALIPTSAASLRPTPIPEGELVLYQTEFDDGDPTLANWKTFAYSFAKNGFVTEGYDTYTVAGIYRIRISDPNQGTNLRVFSIYNKDLSTADVDISTRIEAGHMGLVCRYSEAGWYQFMVEPNGKWSIRLVQYDEAGQLHFRIISSGGRWGREVLRAECKGDRLSFFIDGEKVASLHDSTFPAGKVGVLGWSFDEPGQIGMIDYFTAQRAQSNEIALMDPAPTPDAAGVIYSTDFARMDDLSPYFIRYDAGVIELPGTPHLYGGPGSAESPHTIRYINTFDSGPDVEIGADIQDAVVGRGLICRYNEDGWYQAHYEGLQSGYVILVRMERDEQGQLSHTVLGSQDTPTSKRINLSLKCAGNQISVAVDGTQAIYAEDNTWQSGLSGLMYLNQLPASVKNAFSSYTVRPAQVPQPGEIIYDEIFDTPEKIASSFNLNLEDTRLTIQDNGLLLAPEKDALHPYTTEKYENGELSLDAEFLNASNIVLHCRSNSATIIGAEIRSNGDWNLVLHYEKMLANGNNAGIKVDKNQFTLKCVNSQIILIANGETLANVELPGYTPSTGTSGFDVFEGSQMKVNSLALKIFQSSSTLSAPPLLNQVSTSVYQPGETIYAWNIEDTFYRVGWWGRENRPWIWIFWFNGANPPKKQEDQIAVTASKGMTVWTYRYQDLYDLPIEISAEATITSKAGSVGLFCRSSLNGRYEFLIQPDGRWTIRQNRSDWYAPKLSNMTILAHGTAEPLLPESNQISATCAGSELIFTVNGIELGRAQDDLYPEGTVGIFFDAYSVGSFTNLSIKRVK